MNVYETSKFGFYSSRTAGKRVHRSVGLYVARHPLLETPKTLEHQRAQRAPNKDNQIPLKETLFQRKQQDFIYY